MTTMRAYCEVNRMMALALRRLVQADAQIWVHDYHFLTLAAELRRARRGMSDRLLPPHAVSVRIGIRRRAASSRSRAGDAALRCDRLSDRRRPGRISPTMCGKSWEWRSNGGSLVAETNTRLGSFPIGIDVNAFRRGRDQGGRAAREIARLRASLQAGQLAHRRRPDRLFERAGEPAARLRSAVPDLPRAQTADLAAADRIALARRDPDLRAGCTADCAGMVGDINGRHGEVDWTPIRYLNKGFAQSTLAGFYRTAQVGLVTPLHDGMNLVAKEYVAAQNPLNPGVLVLSQFAGAARQLDAALLVNPHDIDAMAQAVRRALVDVWRRAARALERHDGGPASAIDIDSWFTGFLARLTEPRRPVRAAPFRRSAARSTLASLITNRFGTGSRQEFLIHERTLSELAAQWGVAAGILRCLRGPPRRCGHEALVPYRRRDLRRLRPEEQRLLPANLVARASTRDPRSNPRRGSAQQRMRGRCSQWTTRSPTARSRRAPRSAADLPGRHLSAARHRAGDRQDEPREPF